jgi:cell division protein FtsQ
LPAFLLSVGLGVMLVAFTMSDDFQVDNVMIRGNSIAYADSVVEQSDAIGQPMFRVNTNEIADSVARHPVVESAQVRVVLPDRVIVEIREREPAIVWQTGDRAVLIDEHGWVMAEGDSEHLPRVVEMSGDALSPGAHINPWYVATVQHLNERIGSDGVLEYDELGGFQAYLPDDRVVTFGEPDDLLVKLEVLSALANSGSDWTRLDVRDPDRPVYQ